MVSDSSATNCFRDMKMALQTIVQGSILTLMLAVSCAMAAPPLPSTVLLAPGVTDIIQMSQAHMSDSVIMTYIDNSGTVYNLDAGQVIFLHNQGVSDPVISEMLNQKKKYEEAAQKAAAQAPPAPPVNQPAPAPAPADNSSAVSVYVIPYDPAPGGYYSYLSQQPLYYGALAGYPVGFVSVGVGFDRHHERHEDHHEGGGAHRSLVVSGAGSSFGRLTGGVPTLH